MIVSHFIPFHTTQIVVLITLFLAGLACLLQGGNSLCKGASSISKHMGVSPIIIGLTVVSAATSMPELMASLYGALRGNPGVATGNIIGSNIANSGLVLGVAAMIYPIRVHFRLIKKEIPFLLGATFLFSILSSSGTISRFSGLLLLGAGIYYIYYLIKNREKFSTKKYSKEFEEENKIPKLTFSQAIIYVVAATLLLEIGSELLIDSSIEMAKRMEVSDALIGLTLVALSTSLPEFVTSIMAAVHKHTDICVGNILGSNLFNIFFIGGFVATVTPLPVDPHFLSFGIPALCILTIILAIILITDKKVSKQEGIILVIIYIVLIGISIYLELSSKELVFDPVYQEQAIKNL